MQSAIRINLAEAKTTPAIFPCPRCGGETRQEIRLQPRDGDTTTRYDCPACGWSKLRWHHERR